MEIQFIDEKFELKNFPQYSEIPYLRSLKCPCGFGSYLDSNTYRIVGYCETDHGYMAIMECVSCFFKYRHHIGMDNVYDVDKFKKNAGLILHLQKHR